MRHALKIPAVQQVREERAALAAEADARARAEANAEAVFAWIESPAPADAQRLAPLADHADGAGTVLLPPSFSDGAPAGARWSGTWTVSLAKHQGRPAVQ